MDEKVEIILASYNGERYIEQQILSILNQTYNNWKLTIFDDCSKDRTLKIIKKYTNKYPDKISLQQNEENKKVILNFLSSLMFLKSDYIMFCDQDDFWKPNKIELTLKKMLQNEKKYSKNTPILIHSDLEVVDKDLNTINKSFFVREGINPLKTDFKSALVQNNVVGCTMMINNSLKVLLKKLPKHALMHDWWIKLVASQFGVIGFLRQSTILYRQHSNNCVGAQEFNIKYVLTRVKNGTGIKKTISLYKYQAKEFLIIYKNLIDIETLNFLKNFCKLSEMNSLYRRLFIIKNNMLKDNLLKTFIMLIFI